LPVESSDPDFAAVVTLLGRPPRGAFEVVVRDREGGPVVIRNAPLLDDGTPMPTRFWLVGRAARLAVDRLEAAGGVRQAESEIDPAEVQAAHASYAAERDAALPPGWRGARPSGGVAGTRKGVKCLHAHYAWYLAGGPDPVGQWVATRLMADSAPTAAIDCGTNSTRILIGYPGGPILESRNRITRLGKGVDSTRRLAADAIERTVSTLKEYRQLMDSHGVVRCRMTATSAARDATNSEEFFAAAQDAVGIRPELLSGEEEGRLSFRGATSDLDPQSGPWLIVDIGGGSTEIVVGPSDQGGPQAVRSLDVGCVRITERFLSSDPPTEQERASASAFAFDLISEAVQRQPVFRSGATLVGLAGTVSCLSAIDQGLDEYDRQKLHHHRLTAGAVAGLLDSLASVTSDQRKLRPGVEPARADVIVGGTIILAEIMNVFGFSECLSSEADILDGLILSTAES
jgi:exopolyphosphatase/guanosine-5'-triphosphate,3'-diphosphate pyrophosphatase